MESKWDQIDGEPGVRLITWYEKRALLPELLFRKSGLSFPEIAEDPEFSEDLTQEVFDDLQQTIQRGTARSVSALQTRIRHLEEYVWNMSWACRSCSRLSRRWAARWAWRANLARAASFTLPCPQSHPPVNGRRLLLIQSTRTLFQIHLVPYELLIFRKGPFHA